MKICRHYIMIAKVGHEEEVVTILRGLGDFAAKLPGFVSFNLMQDRDNAERIFVAEDWETVEDHQRAFIELPKDEVDRLFSALDREPDGAYLKYLEELKV